jgi:protein-S-isoprenylcysteine O-methyltransferase
MISLVGLIIGIFQLGTMSYTDGMKDIRLIGLIVYIVFSWIQIWAYKSLGSSYSQEVVILKNHRLITAGPFKFIRHPQYLSQILLDLGAGFAILSYILIPLAVIEIPFLLLRAGLEEKLMAKYFKDDFKEYKKNTGFMLPFIG